MKNLVKVTWWDAQDHPLKWVGEEDATSFGDTSCVIISIGFLVSKTDRYITLAADWDDDDKDYGRVTKVPAGMVVSIHDLVVKAEE